MPLEELQRTDRALRKATYVFYGLIFVVMTSLGLTAVVLQHQENRNAEIDRDRLIHLTDLVVEVLGCEEGDSPEECRAKVANAGKQEGLHRVAEIDCRARRLHQGKPPIPPNEFCVPPEELGF